MLATSPKRQDTQEAEALHTGRNSKELNEEALKDGGQHLQALSSNRALDEAKKQVVSFLQWLDKWALNVIPKCDRFHKESRIIFHIIIYKVINAFWFPPAFSSLLYGTRGDE